MESSSKLRILSAALLLVFLLMTSGREVVMVEGRHCESQSFTFKGPCGRSDNCANVCKGEGFHGGKCRGHLLHRKCFCIKPC